MTRGAFSRSDIIVILEDEYFISLLFRLFHRWERHEERGKNILNYEYFIDGNHPRAISRWNSSLRILFLILSPILLFFSFSISSRLLKSNAQNGWSISLLLGWKKRRISARPSIEQHRMSAANRNLCPDKATDNSPVETTGVHYSS